MKIYENKIFCAVAVLLLWFSLSVQAQKAKKTYKAAPRPANTCSEISGYIPYNPQQMPIKRIRLVLHIMQKDDGTGNLQNTPEHMEFMKKVLNHANHMYMHLDTVNPQPEGENIPFLRDSRIRLVVDTILFHRNTEDWNYRKEAGYYDKSRKDTMHDVGKSYVHTEKMYKKYVENSDVLSQRQKDSALNVFMFEAKNMHNRGMAQTYYSSRWLYLIGTYFFYNDSPGPNHWHPAMLLAHEVGHNFGLEHPYDGHICNDLPRTGKGKSNNIMDSWPGQGQALTPCQIGQMHWAMSGNTGTIAKAVITDWCAYHPDSTMYISKGDTAKWEGHRNLLGDLVIEAGAVLVVKCNVSMPVNSNIIIHPNGALIIDGGFISNACGQRWDGIIMEKRRPMFGIFKRKTRSLFQIFNDGAFSGSERGLIKVEFD